ncbi:hypothetical protein [Nocardioides sp. B-3]|uniref:hypothetical protein n=1 Tax=Nocardioides sp. B-3 TaxID=2895565 RepID=UPI002152D2C3|nr:hypothetical protein [Nocardioides sp. B-3]UUZ61365.1 hypothetical protein LP418_12760 [Nocardioides sp. B-3]
MAAFVARIVGRIRGRAGRRDDPRLVVVGRVVDVWVEAVGRADLVLLQGPVPVDGGARGARLLLGATRLEPGLLGLGLCLLGAGLLVGQSGRPVVGPARAAVPLGRGCRPGSSCASSRRPTR